LLLVQEEIGGFNISVYDIDVVELDQPPEDLNCIIPDLLFRYVGLLELVLLYDLQQVPSLHEFSHYPELLFVNTYKTVQVVENLFTV
jgi:hypothetical protein